MVVACGTIHSVNSRLDHVGFVGPDLAALRSAFMRLGFSPTMPQPLMRRDSASGVLVPLEQSSCHIVLDKTYIELSASHTTDPNHHLAAYACAAPRLQILAFASDDIDAAHSALVSAGIRATNAAWAARAIHYGSRRGEARFRWYMVEPQDSPEGLVCFVRNATPELVYQPEVQRHPVGARAVTGIAIVLPSRQAASITADRYERYLGGNDPAVKILDAQLAEAAMGSWARQATSAFAGLAVEVDDLVAAATALAAQGVPHEARAAGLIVPPAYAGGAALCLHGPGRVFF
jgi:Glyoxalase-like domain